jgi:hypothetical protein
MTKPIPVKAEVALEYPDKFYIGTFERTARFDAHLDKTGIALTFQRGEDAASKKSVSMHLHYALFAEILEELARTVSAKPPEDTAHRDALRDASKAMFMALNPTQDAKQEQKNNVCLSGNIENSKMTPKEEVLLLHIME